MVKALAAVRSGRHATRATTSANEAVGGILTNRRYHRTVCE